MTLENFMVIVNIIMALNGVIVLLAFLFYRKRALQVKLLGLHFVFQLLGYYSLAVYDAKGMEVNIPGNALIFVSFLLTTGIYYVEFKKRFTRIFITIASLFTIFGLINVFFVQKMYFNSYTASLANSFVITYCVVYFYRLMIDLPTRHLQRVPMFWISTGLLVLNAGALFLYLFTAYLTKFFFSDVLIYWTFHNLLQIFELLLIITGVSVDLRNSVARTHKVPSDLDEPHTFVKE